MKLIPAALPQTQAAPAGPSLEDIQQKRAIAALLAKEGQSSAPVQHWTQAAARVANAMMSSLNQSQAASEDARLRGEANDAIMGMLPSLTGGASQAGMPPQPVKNDAQDAIDMTPDQKGVYQVAQGLATPGFQAAVQERQPQIDPNLVAGVKGFEGYAGKAYPDYKQYSIGYGTRATSPNEVIDQAEADRRLNSELGKAQGIVKAFAPNAPPGVQNALTSLTYNTGDKWTRSGLGALVKAGDYQGAQQRLLQYNKAGGVTNQGLVNRRQQEAQWMNGQPQQPQGVQVADASGQTVGGMDRAALAKMLANPYTKDFAEKLIMQRMKGASGADLPANIQEWNIYNKMGPEDQQRFIEMKRANKYLDLGTGFVNPSTGQTVQKDLQGAERLKKIGEAEGTATGSAPADIAAMDDALTLLDDIKNDPSLDIATGFSSYGNVIPGTPGYDFQQKVNQAKSGAFLTAIQKMRGMGSLSNAEGETATKAVTRMGTALSRDAFLAALADYERIVKRGRKKAEDMLAKYGNGQTPQAAPSGQGKVPKYNPQTGEFE